MMMGRRLETSKLPKVPEIDIEKWQKLKAEPMKSVL